MATTLIAAHMEGHLRGMAVLPSHLGAGVAGQLLTTAERELRDQQCVRITLDTTEPLRRAVRFYEKHGYRPSGRVTDFFGTQLVEYEKTLTRAVYKLVARGRRTPLQQATIKRLNSPSVLLRPCDTCSFARCFGICRYQYSLKPRVQSLRPARPRVRICPRIPRRCLPGRIA